MKVKSSTGEIRDMGVRRILIDRTDWKQTMPKIPANIKNAAFYLFPTKEDAEKGQQLRRHRLYCDHTVKDVREVRSRLCLCSHKLACGGTGKSRHSSQHKVQSA